VEEAWAVLEKFFVQLLSWRTAGQKLPEIVFQLFVASRVGVFLDHAAEDGLEKTVVFGEGELIVEAKADSTACSVAE
jgi:hypothetical protein